jgi:hypothetical protein
MSEKIEVGDDVRVVMATNDLFGSCDITAKVLYMPHDIGDMIHILTDDGATVYINPMAGDFTGMVLFRKEGK